MNTPSRQEMLDRAVRGLRVQGFSRSVRNGLCTYDDGAGKKCAWGHVDPEARGTGGIDYLQRKGIGLAPRLSEDDLSFVVDLQKAHDRPSTPETMVSALRDLAATYSLTYPEPEEHEPKDPS